jgi:UMF1 family MFS transporter
VSVIVPLFAAVGGYAWHAAQVRTGWSSKRVLVLNLLFLAVLPLWGCVGFFTKSIGLRKPAELYVLAVWFGMCLGSAQAFGRAVFSELIPKGHESDMFALFEITDKGSSWMGPLIAASVVQTTGKIRPVLIYLLCAMVLPGGLLHALDLEPSIRAAKGDTALAIDGTEDADDVK